MALKGIDISKWQQGLNAGTIEADFVICKATEGVGYVDSQCDKFYQQAKAAGKLLGVYHFARPDGNDPISEANFFVDQIQGYIGEAVLVLDWEVEPKSNVMWAKQWLDKVYERTGVRPMIYMSLSVANDHNWAPIWNDYGLWVARYWDMSPDYNYDMTNAGPAPDVKWPYGYAMWQWTSSGRLNGWAGNLDCNQFYGDATAWKAYARARVTTPEPTPPVEPTPTPPTPPTPPVEPPTVPTPEPTPPIEPAPTPNPGDDALSWLKDLWEWIKSVLSKFHL